MDVARLLWLPGVLRAAGLTVVEVDGWRTRGGDDYDPAGVIAHDTGSSSWTSSDAGEIRVMIEGRADLPGPIGQAYLSRTGIWHMVTSGRSNHVLTGWGGPYEGLGNRRLLGIEAQHAPGEPWSPVQYRSYVRGVAAILEHTGWPTVAGHKEHQPGAKVDPGFDMDVFRRDVAALRDGDDVKVLVRRRDRPEVWISDGITRRWVQSQAELDALKAAAKAGHIQLAMGGAVQVVPSLDPYGRDVAVAATVAMSVEDRAAIVADLAALLLGREAAADRARADVLGAVVSVGQ